jgi:hypothetical protein
MDMGKDESPLALLDGAVRGIKSGRGLPHSKKPGKKHPFQALLSLRLD